ncbi:hypothetical protein ED312_13805 [Sinomicrobium pectinilyticum]|uniref:PorT family protein n=1 Tax=Sinomicrobium pectinilyticum TaxID=1084421 RepID=A0A3N0E9T0_SINP1|nr:hypothetical protein [Sinomicrobium pectinilyticum]RNL84499.1 hypothetical protein ED312_13805 [Sinomicrobium pectinilyticum]
MLRIISYITYVILLFIAQNLCAQAAQEKDSSEIRTRERVLKAIDEEKERVVREEKSRLKKEVEFIRELETKGEITKEEAQNRKEEKARRTALNIENKLAVLENKRALVERGEEKGWEYLRGATLGIGIGSNYDGNGSRLIGIQFENVRKDKKYDRRTYSNIVVALGFNNALIEGESLNDSPYKTGGSRFFELGWQWKTRILKNSNAVRVSYGLSFQSNGLKPESNQYFEKEGEITRLKTYPYDLKKSKFRQDNLVVPVFFEFGPSKRTDYDDYFRYSTRKKINVGIGGYAGINLTSRQKLKYTSEGRTSREKIKDDYNTNNFVYGLAAYAGIGGSSLYLKYDLNPVFKSPNIKQNNISLGLRFEL